MSISVFSITLTISTRTRNREKSIIVTVAQISMYGDFAQQLPIYIRMKKSTTSSQKLNCMIGRNWLPHACDVSTRAIA
jgi:hypothetical protein